MAYKRISPQPVVEGGTGDQSFTAYSVICGGTTSTGALQNVSGVGTSGQVLTSNGASNLPTWQPASGGSAFQVMHVQVFTSSGTYTPTANMQYCTIEVVGGGGGGGGCATNGASNVSAAGGGGGGGYGRKTVSAATIGASQTVTVGAAGAAGSAGNNAGGTGGTTSVGSIVSATGGVGGSGGPTVTASTTASLGGAGGVGSSGDINTTGSAGGASTPLFITGIAQFTVSGVGGASFLGGGGAAVSAAGSAQSAGSAGTVYGGGGSGAAAGSSGTQSAGGAGAAGVVVITEFVS